MKIALFQARTGIDPAHNADALVTACREAAAGGATMVFTPEMSGLLDRDSVRAAPNLYYEAEDPVLRSVRAEAAQAKIWVQLGSLAIRRSDGRLVNRSFVIDPEGAIRARYDKIHLFDVDLPSGESWRESARYAAGDQAVVADTPVGKLGLTICYDLRFAALFNELARAGSVAFSAPAAFTVPTGRAHWQVLCRARAIENGAFVIAAAQCGLHEDGRETFGHGLVVDPWGEVLLDMGRAENEVGFAEVEADAVERARGAVPALRHGRPFNPAAPAG